MFSPTVCCQQIIVAIGTLASMATSNWPGRANSSVLACPTNIARKPVGKSVVIKVVTHFTYAHVNYLEALFQLALGKELQRGSWTEHTGRARHNHCDCWRRTVRLKRSESYLHGVFLQVKLKIICVLCVMRDSSILWTWPKISIWHRCIFKCWKPLTTLPANAQSRTMLGPLDFSIFLKFNSQARKLSVKKFTNFLVLACYHI